MRHVFETCLIALILFSSLLVCPANRTCAADLGLFEGQTDVGVTRHAGAAEFDSATGRYTVSGGGENMWFAEDALHFVWRQISGDVSLEADISFVGTGGNAHRKACLLVRQDLNSDSAYADAALHGDGLTSLQYREVKGDRTYEIQANVSSPRRLRIEKRGKYVSMSIANEGAALQPAGGSFRLILEDPFYVGIGVCAHDENALEKAVFSNVNLIENTQAAPGQELISTLETVPISSRDRRAVFITVHSIESPSWSRDGSSLFFNSRGRIMRLPASGGEPQRIDTGFARQCNGYHGLSPDGKQLGISDLSQSQYSRLYVLPVIGGTPERVTKFEPADWNSWSPDGSTLAFTGARNGESDVYTIPVRGGRAQRLTNAQGLDGGADYHPDGEHIYFHSNRTGRMQIWRMRADGTQQEPITSDQANNGFPHPSPDGRWLVFLSSQADLANTSVKSDVTLKLMSIPNGNVEVLAKLYGGQGTIRVPSWSPDSRRLAFVSYQPVP